MPSVMINVFVTLNIHLYTVSTVKPNCVSQLRPGLVNIKDNK